MKLNQNDILAAIRDSKRSSLSIRELTAVLTVSAGTRKILNRLLRDMERQRLLKRIRGGRYALARPTELLEGVISLNKRGEGMVEMADGARVRIPANYLGNASDGDRIRYSVLRRDRMNRLNGRVVDIIERSGKLVIGSFQQGRDSDFILPVDATFNQPILVDHDDKLIPQTGDWVVVRPQQKIARDHTSRGQLIDVLGNPEDPEVAMMASACRFSIPLHFPENVVNAAERIDSICTDEDLASRKDLRDLPFVTIDGETARDFDDAVTLAVEGDHYRLYVAIADVSHYVLEKDSIDLSAHARGTSVYFPGYCIPMLPEKLSNDVCSLKPDVDRLVMVAEILFDQKGKSLNADFYPAAIKSQGRLTYNQVQDYLDQCESPASESSQGPMTQLQPMLLLSQILTHKRLQRGALELDIPEAEILLDESGHPEAIRFSARLQAHRIVEEFMLAANEAVAHFLSARNYDLPYRIHEPPEPHDFIPLNNFLAAQSGRKLSFKHDLHSDLQRLVHGVEDETVKRVVSRLVLQSMKQARYSVENVGHYGLAAEKYCHFTSPIRRYPDLLVHRILKRCLKGEDKIGKESLADMSEHSSQRERLAVDAERDVQAMLACRFMQDKIGNEYDGTINSVQKFGLFIELADFPVEGLVHISKMDDDYYHFDAELNRLTGERSGSVYSIGNKVKISVENVSIARREIDYRLVQSSDRKPAAPFVKKGRKRKSWR